MGGPYDCKTVPEDGADHQDQAPHQSDEAYDWTEPDPQAETRRRAEPALPTIDPSSPNLLAHSGKGITAHRSSRGVFPRHPRFFAFPRVSTFHRFLGTNQTTTASPARSHAYIADVRHEPGWQELTDAVEK